MLDGWLDVVGGFVVGDESLIEADVAEDVIAHYNQMLWGISEKKIHQVGTIGCDDNVGIFEENVFFLERLVS